MKRLLALFALSIGLGLAGLYVATRDALLDPAAYVPTGWSWPLAALAAACLLTIWTLPLVKLVDLAAWHRHRLKPYQAWLTHVASVFGVAMTPSGTGGGPGMMMALHRFGVPAGTALGIAVQVLVLDLLVFAVLIPLGLAYLVLVSPVEMPWRLELAALAAALIGGAAALVLVRYPRPVVRLLLAAAAARWTGRFGPCLRGMAREYYRGAVSFRGMRAPLWSKLLAINAIAWLANFLLFWVLLRLYGLEAPAPAILAVLAMLTLVSFVVPTPGASGFMEFVVGVAMSERVPSESVAPPILLWRAGTFYLVYVLGPLAGWLILLDRPPRWLRRLGRMRRMARVRARRGDPRAGD